MLLFSLSFPLLGTWHHDFPSCLIQSLRIHPGLSLFFIPYTQPILKTHWFSLHICVLLPQPQPTQPPCPLYPPHFRPHPWISSLTQHPPVVLKIPVLITTHKALQEPSVWPLPPSLAFVSHSPFDSWSFIGGWRVLFVLPQALSSSWLTWILIWMTPWRPFTQSPDLFILRALSFLPLYVEVTLVMFMSCQFPPLRAEVCHKHHRTPRPSEQFLTMGSTHECWMNKCIHPSFELPLRICDGPHPGNFHSIPLSLSISQARQWTNEAKASSCIIYCLAPAETAHKGYLVNSYWIKVIIEKNLQTNSGDSVEKREPCYTFGDNVDWFSHYGDQYRSFLKNLKQNYHMTQQSHYWAYTLKKT